MLGRIGALVLLAAAGCGSGADGSASAGQCDASFICGNEYPDDCPPQQPCPDVSPDPSSCLETDVLRSAPPDVRVPVGCVASLYAERVDGVVVAKQLCEKCYLQMDAGGGCKPAWRLQQ